MTTDLLENFHIYIFSILKISSAIPLPRLERGLSGLPFAYSLYGVLFPICCQMAIDLLGNFQSQFSQYHITLYGTILLIVLRGLGDSFEYDMVIIDLVNALKLDSKQVTLFRWILLNS